MTVFKTFWKVVKKYKGTIILYTSMLIIFGGINLQTNNTTTTYVDKKPDILIINNDKEEGLTKNLINYINENTNIKEIKNDEEAINDALFYRDVNYIIYIPKNYRKDVLEGKNPTINIKSSKDYNSSLAEMILKNYIKIQNIYANEIKDEKEIINSINNTLTKKSNIQTTTKLDTNKLLKVSRYFNFASYSIMAVIIYIVCLVLNSFNNETVRKRTIISSMNYKEHSKQILFASLLYSIIVWILYVLLGIILLGDILLQTRGLIYILNVLIFTITSLTIALLISSLIKNKGAISGVVNVVALGSAFLCGSFIPLEWLPNSVLRISKILPTYYYAINNNNLFQMLKRYNNAPLAKPVVINMQEYGKSAYRGILSKPLQTEIQEAVESGKQVILLMNRRGFSTYTQCKACGAVVECPDCSIPLVWHADGKKLKCHYCSKEMSFPEFCPTCGSDALATSGSGTQKIEQFVKELYPDYRVERIDSDILTRKNAHIELLGKFQRGEIDILVGTQMIAKGLDNPNVTLVGVISADTGFSVPDYRASERGFQLLTQVAGRAGRGEYKGKVLFQTYNPDYYAFQSAKSQNYEKFFDTEIKARQEYDYPPFSQIIRVILSSLNNFRAEKSAMEIVMRLNTMTEKFGFTEYLETLGPTPCIISKINGYYRFQILIKNKISQKGHDFVNKFFSKITMPKDIKLSIDVDPLDIL